MPTRCGACFEDLAPLCRWSAMTRDSQGPGGDAGVGRRTLPGVSAETLRAVRPAFAAGSEREIRVCCLQRQVSRTRRRRRRTPDHPLGLRD